MDSFDDKLKHLEQMSQEGMDEFLQSDDSSDVSYELDERIDRRIAHLQPTRKRHLSLLMRVAAGLLLLAAAYILFFRSFSQSASDQLFAEHFVPFEDVITTHVERGAKAEAPDVSDVMKQYNQGQYTQFLDAKIFDDLAVPAQPLLAIYQANALMKLNRSDEAVSILSQLINSTGENPYQDITQWYLALAYVHQGQDLLAQQLLTSITSAEGHYKKKQAQALLEALNAQK